MANNILVSSYSINKHQYKHIHSAAPHIYFNNPVIGYVTKGYAKFLYKGQTLYAHKGDLIYISTGTKYHSIWFGSPDIEWYSIDFKFNYNYALSEYQFQIYKNFPVDLFEKIYEAYTASPMLSISYFYQLLDDLYKKLTTTAPTLSNISIEPAIEYIENHYNQNFTVQTLAELCHCSESGFFKLFKKATNVTPVSYKHNIMIQNALELLSHTNMSVEEISAQVGFSSSNHFRTVFFKLTGKTPKELRKSK